MITRRDKEETGSKQSEHVLACFLSYFDGIYQNIIVTITKETNTYQNKSYFQEFRRIERDSWCRCLPLHGTPAELVLIVELAEYLLTHDGLG